MIQILFVSPGYELRGKVGCKILCVIFQLIRKSILFSDFSLTKFLFY